MRIISRVIPGVSRLAGLQWVQCSIHLPPLRYQPPDFLRWGKDKLTVLLHGEGFDCSTVGRILHKLKERGVLKEPVPNHISTGRRWW